MSLHVTAMGTLVAHPVRRTGQAGRPFTTATLRVPSDGAEAFLASLIAFDARVAEHAKGDTIVAGGRASLNPPDASQRPRT